MLEGNEGGQPGQAPEGGVPSVGPGRGGKPLTGVDGPNGWMDGFVRSQAEDVGCWKLGSRLGDEGRRGGGVRREAKIRWELLGREEVAEEYCRRVGEVVRGVEEQEGKELGV